ncbi:ATP synthase regulation protein NCA2-domain-containing protein [Morchella snyderi]|nr:ATP synthase regulation protein NCA2-domain-containing protein [Morchella snyderi]
MTFITDQLAHLDAQLDRLQLDRLPAAADHDHDDLVSPFTRSFSHHSHAALTPSTHTQHLQSLIKALSALPNRPLTPHRIVALLQSASLDPAPSSTHTLTSTTTTSEHSAHDLELEWILLSKATIQTYGIVLNSLLAQTLPLTQDMFYWDSVVSSPLATALYTLQTAPSRVTAFATEILSDALRRLRELREMERIPVLPGPYTIDHDHSDDGYGYGRIELPQPEWLEAPSETDSLSLTARKFYALVRNALHEREWRMGAVSPLALARHEIGRKRAAVRRLREMKASALGVLIGEGLSFGFEDAAASGGAGGGAGGGEDGDEWKGIVERAVTLMENVVRNVSTVDTTLDEFEETVFALDKPSSPSPSSPTAPTTATGAPPRPTAALARQLVDILTVHLPAQTAASRALITTHGRPSALTRYWIPLTALLLSSTTLLRLLSSRRAALATWLRDLGATTVDFWNNWVIDPTRSLIGTIRHSADSEVALMSRDSLAADMHSLERMVVDFAMDNPAMASPGGGPLTEAALDGVRARVKMGDLTPVLRAYERDLRRPLRGAMGGELVRALLIQVQKTKVDVEVAISGIDRLLKSQELVFGMVGVTPGVLVCVGLVQWVRGCVGGRRGRRSWARAGEMVRVLRNVDRILGGSRGLLGGENGGMLSYKEHGLLLCEVHVLREFARGVLPRGVRAEFVEDVEEMVDVRRGVRGQLRVVERVRWAYAKWIK